MKTKIFNIAIVAILLIVTILFFIFDRVDKLYFIINFVLSIYILTVQIKNFKDAQKITETTKKLEKLLQDEPISPLYKKLHDTNLNLFIYYVDKTIHYLHNRIENKKRFNSNLAHEILKPLTLLRSEIDIAFYDTHRNTIENIIEKIQELEDISKQLLILSNTSDFIVKQSMQRIFLHTVLQKAIIDKQDEILRKNINLINDIYCIVSIHANEVLLKLAFANLLDNAIKYTDPGGRIYVGIKKKKNFIYCIIQDNGYGIDKDDLKLVFNPFYRGIAHHKSIEGYGIGLTLASTVFKLHQIDYKIRSLKNQGTTILIKIPF